MNNELRDVSLLIGLHKLAAQNGDGLVPELYALLSARSDAAPDITNVVALPAAPKSAETCLGPGEAGRNLAFAR
jgi:hypothetical protein